MWRTTGKGVKVKTKMLYLKNQLAGEGTDQRGENGRVRRAAFVLFMGSSWSGHPAKNLGK